MLVGQDIRHRLSVEELRVDVVRVDHIIVHKRIVKKDLVHDVFVFVLFVVQIIFDWWLIGNQFSIAASICFVA